MVGISGKMTVQKWYAMYENVWTLRQKVTRDRENCVEDFHNLYSTKYYKWWSNQGVWGGNRWHEWLIWNAFRFELGKPKVKKPLGRRRTLEDNIKVGLKEIASMNFSWIYLARERTWWRVCVNITMNILLPQKAENFLTSWAYCRLLKTDSAPSS
jgi:hypothetical protein